MNKLLSRKLVRYKLLISIAALVIVAPIAVYAQTSLNTARLEAETGTATGGVTYVDSTLASGGRFAQFITDSGGGDSYANIPSNFDINQYLNSNSIPESTANEPSGNFRTVCRPSHLAWDDPIVYPGQPGAAHLHLFFGNTEANAHSTYQSLRTTGGSTCEGGPINRTGYWMPALFDGQDRVIPPELVIVYYKSTASGGTLERQQEEIRSVAGLPNGLRMIAGAPDGHYSWLCGDGSGEGTRIPTSCPAGGELIASIGFPTCWDGVNLDSPNHRSHMAYKSYVNGIHTCPSTHPVIIPEITEKFFWYNTSNVGTWKISSDMGATPGSTLHADWFGAWDNGISDRWLVQCLRGMRNSNNGNLCDGQSLSGATWGMTADPKTGWTPMSN